MSGIIFHHLRSSIRLQNSQPMHRNINFCRWIESVAC